MADVAFVTSCSGHIGSRVIIDALRAWYHVRAAVCSQAKADKILLPPSVKALRPGNKLDFVVVPDLLAEGAYDKAIRGAMYAIHVASRLTDAQKESETYERIHIKPAVQEILNILEAAKKIG